MIIPAFFPIRMINRRTRVEVKDATVRTGNIAISPRLNLKAVGIVDQKNIARAA